MTDTWRVFSAFGNGKLVNADLTLYSGAKANDGIAGISHAGRNITTGVGGKYYFEIAVTDPFPPSTFGSAVGIADPQNSANNLFLYPNGDIYAAAKVHTITVPATGLNGIVRVAAGNGQVWWSINGGPWNGDPAADPAANVGGFSISPTALDYVYGDAENEGAGQAVNITINTGPAFAFAVPAGFSAWDAEVSVFAGPPSVSAGSPNPPAPNRIDPGHTTGVRWVVPG